MAAPTRPPRAQSAASARARKRAPAVDTTDARLVQSRLRGWSRAYVTLLEPQSCAPTGIRVLSGVAVVLVCTWRGIRLGLTRHRAKRIFQSLFSLKLVEEAF